MKKQNEIAKNQEAQAMKKYHAGYDNHLYAIATCGKETAYANSLINEALAICGSPYYKLSFRNWSKAALNFLSRFS